MSALTFLLILHSLWHLIATVGIAWSFWHSDRAHGHKPWKIAAGILWLGISVVVLATSMTHDQKVDCTCISSSK